MNHLGKKLLISQLAVLLFFPASCFGDYIIHLKDGGSFTTSKYVEEGNEIKFERYGGFIGIQKSQIEQIEETADLAEEKKAEALPAISSVRNRTPPEPQVETSGETQTGGEEPSDASAEAKANSGPSKQEQMDILLEQKRSVEREIDWLNDQFKEAKRKGDGNAKREYFQKLKKMRGQLLEIERKARALSDGKLPDWWRDA